MRTHQTNREELVGIDVGGTFTDFVWLVDGRLTVRKEATTPQDQSRAVETGLEALGVGTHADISHGTTAATNALLERRGSRCALITTAGFADVLAIGRQNRPYLYRLSQQRPPVLIPSELRFEVPERNGHDGRIHLPLDEQAVRRIAAELVRLEVESVAVVLLFSFRNPAHERRIGEILHEVAPNVAVSLSVDVLPEYREFERTATTAVNAYVQPVIGRYARRLQDVVGARPIRVMQSNGGAIGVADAAQHAARLVLSGPAGGVVGAFSLAQTADGGTPPRIITFDMGGTSTDVALCNEGIPTSSESEIAGLPLRLPSVDIHTVGAGGGSIARVDSAGVLRVGPESAGSDPGPVCYGRGGSAATVTDANVVLGRIQPDQFLGGASDLDGAAAHEALEALGRGIKAGAESAAMGVIRVANAAMERALRRVSVERGHDPRAFTLVPFGGAGPLHACELADALGIRRILLPPNPGVLSALGLLMADVVADRSAAALQLLGTSAVPALRKTAEDTADAARKMLSGYEDVRVELSGDVRYRGQSYELEIPLSRTLDEESLHAAAAAFHDAHRARYGHALPDEPVEIVTIRARATASGAVVSLPFETERRSDPDSACIGSRAVWTTESGQSDLPCYDRSLLHFGHAFAGPALVFQYDTTIYVAPGWHADVDSRLNLRLRRAS